MIKDATYLIGTSGYQLGRVFFFCVHVCVHVATSRLEMTV